MVKPLDSYVVCKIVTLRERGLSKKLKKSWAINLDRQLKQLISVFENELLCGEKTSRPARKAQQKRAKTNILKSGKDPKTTLERVRVLQIFFNVNNKTYNSKNPEEVRNCF